MTVAKERRKKKEERGRGGGGLSSPVINSDEMQRQREEEERKSKPNGGGVWLELANHQLLWANSGGGVGEMGEERGMGDERKERKNLILCVYMRSVVCVFLCISY